MLKLFQSLGVFDNLSRELCLFVELEKQDTKYLATFSIGRDSKYFGNYLDSKRVFPDIKSAKAYIVNRLSVFKYHRFVRDYMSSLHPVFSSIRQQVLLFNE